MSCFFFTQVFNHATKQTIATTKFSEAKMPEKNFKLAILYIDFTKSTIMSKIGNVKNLHNESSPNPFEILLSAFVRMLWDHIELDLETNMKYIRLYGFGCVKTEDKSVFYMHPNGSRGASGKNVAELEASVLSAYRKVRNDICVTKDNLSGPTDYSPSIYNTLNSMVELKSSSGELPNTFMGMLLDGQTDHEVETKEAIGRATFFPVSIVLCAIGNNSFTKLKQYDELGKINIKDNNNEVFTTSRDIVQSTLANDFVIWVMKNQRHRNFETEYLRHLQKLKSNIMNEIPEQCKQITNDILKFNQRNHGKKCKQNLIVFDCERKKSSNKPIPPIETTPTTTSGLADGQSTHTAPPQPIESKCFICEDVESNAFLSPCGHNGICLTCARTLVRNGQTCPICRQQIQNVYPMYRVQ